MKYTRFEALAFVLGSAAIVASVFVPATAAAMPAEVVAQLLMIVVLAGALHWGRNGGFIAALIATAIYVGMRFSVLQAEGLSGDAMTMIVSRVAAYAVIGVAGGELSSRLKYLLARVEHGSMVDHETGLYSAAYAGQAIRSAHGQWMRYEKPYSVVVFVLTPAVWSALKPARMTALLRRIASHLRNDIRMVDDVAYHANGRFLVLLPETPAEGASVAASRLRSGVIELLGTTEDTVTAEVLSFGSDDAALIELAAVLAPEPTA